MSMLASSEKREKITSEQGEQIGAAYEQRLADEATVREREREDKHETLTLEAEFRETWNSTAVAPLRERRIFELLARRDSEITLGHVERPDALGVFVNAYLRGLRWNPRAEEWLPVVGVKPARPRVTLRRTDSCESFTFKLKRRDDLSLAVEKELTRAWSCAPPDKRGPDPTAIHVRVEPDSNGCFTLPLDAALTCFRQHRDTHIRSRNRRSGVEQSRPIVAEANGPGAAFVPVVPLAAEDLR